MFSYKNLSNIYCEQYSPQTGKKWNFDGYQFLDARTAHFLVLLQIRLYYTKLIIWSASPKISKLLFNKIESLTANHALPSIYIVFVTQYVELPLQKGQMRPVVFVENMVILCMKNLAPSYLISKYLDVNQGAIWDGLIIL